MRAVLLFAVPRNSRFLGLHVIPHRSDAVARRVLLLDAAEAVFAAHGINAPLDLVLEFSGLGRATLYRNFPNRKALMEELLQRVLQELQEEADSLHGRDDALFQLLGKLANRTAELPALVDYWRTVDRGDPVVIAARNRLGEIFRESLRDAIGSGMCRPDLLLSDISLVLGMLGASLRGRSASERQFLAHRALTLLLGGLRHAGEKSAKRPLQRVIGRSGATVTALKQRAVLRSLRPEPTLSGGSHHPSRLGGGRPALHK